MVFRSQSRRKVGLVLGRMERKETSIAIDGKSKGDVQHAEAVGSTGYYYTSRLESKHKTRNGPEGRNRRMISRGSIIEKGTKRVQPPPSPPKAIYVIEKVPDDRSRKDWLA